jgi:hypothetical protein
MTDKPRSAERPANDLERAAVRLAKRAARLSGRLPAAANAPTGDQPRTKYLLHLARALEHLQATIAHYLRGDFDKEGKPRARES